MTGMRWRKLNPLFPDPYPLVLDVDGNRSLKSDGFIGVCHQIPGEWFWRGWVLAHGSWHHFAWPCLQTAAWDLHRHLHDSRDLGRDWTPATWFEGHLPCSVRQNKGRPNISGSWRLSLEGNVLTLRVADGNPKRSPSIWQTYWNGQRVVAKKGFNWSDKDSAQQAAEDFDLGSRPEAYRLR